MHRLELKEYEDRRWDGPLTLDQVQALSMAHISVSRSADKEDAYSLKPSSYVGAVNIGDLSVIVRPKIDVARVMFLIIYAMDPSLWKSDKSIELDRADDVLEAVAQVFTHRTQQAIRRGLLRGYRREEEALNTVRGQIRFADQIRRRFGLPLPIEVAYDEYTEDIEQNRLLKTAIHRLAHTEIRSVATRQEVRRLRPAFEMVQLGSYPRGAVPEIRYTRLDEHYRPAVELARLIIDNSSLELSGGRVSGASFLIDMNVLFEQFLYVALMEALGLSKDQWRRGESLYLDEGKRIKMEPDLSWWSTGRTQNKGLPRFVGDAKYKKLDEKSYENQRRPHFRHADIYQMLAYCTAADLPSGLLIYAAGVDEPAEYRINHAGKTIEVASLDLSGTPETILASVRQLADRVRDHVLNSPLQAVA